MEVVEKSHCLGTILNIFQLLPPPPTNLKFGLATIFAITSFWQVFEEDPVVNLNPEGRSKKFI